MDQYEGKPLKAYDNIDEYNAMLEISTVETEISIDQAVDGAFPDYRPTTSRVNAAMEAASEITPVMVALDMLDEMYGIHSDYSRMHLMTGREVLNGFSIADLLQAGMLKEALKKIEDDIASSTKLREHNK